MRETAPTGVWCIITPGGFIVPGLRDRNEARLCSKYARIVSSTWAELRIRGYCTWYVERRPRSSSLSSEPRDG